MNCANCADERDGSNGWRRGHLILGDISSPDCKCLPVSWRFNPTGRLDLVPADYASDDVERQAPAVTFPDVPAVGPSAADAFAVAAARWAATEPGA